MVKRLLGKHHIVVNEATAMLTLGYVSSVAISSGVILTPVFGNFYHLVDIAIVATAVCLGALLPDIDSKTSILGRYFHLPVEHRTWTHSLFALILLLPSLWAGLFGRWVWIGYLLHLLFDNLSAGGVCFRYPFETYRVYPNGAKVKPHHWCKCYHTGKSSESYFTWFYVGLCALLFCSCLF